MNKLDLYEIAEAHGLQVIETTSQANGYPSNLRYALIGFESFDDARALAETYGLKITSFHKRDGWQLWHRRGDNVYEPMYIVAGDYGDDYLQHIHSDADTFFEDECKPFLEDINSFEELETFISERKDLYEHILECDESEMVISYNGRYYETIKQSLMQWSHDTHTYAIGLIENK